MTPNEKAMLELARKFYPVNLYGNTTPEQLFTWLADDALMAAARIKRQGASNAKK